MLKHAAEDYAAVMPYLTVKDGSAALAFYRQVFDAEVVQVIPLEDGAGVLHARFFVNGSMLMLCEETPQIPTGAAAPETIGGTAVTIRLRLEQEDAVSQIFERALAAGGEEVQQPVIKPWGECYARFRDIAGHVWALGAATS